MGGTIKIRLRSSRDSPFESASILNVSSMESNARSAASDSLAAIQARLRRRNASGSQMTRYFTASSPIVGELLRMEFPPSVVHDDRAHLHQTAEFHLVR